MIIRLAFTAAFLLPMTAVAAEENSQCKATASAFQQIQLGMSHEQVVAIIGCDGREVSSVVMPSLVTRSIVWNGNGSPALSSLHAEFKNDALDAKRHLDLR